MLALGVEEEVRMIVLDANHNDFAIIITHESFLMHAVDRPAVDCQAPLGLVLLGLGLHLGSVLPLCRSPR